MTSAQAAAGDPSAGDRQAARGLPLAAGVLLVFLVGCGSASAVTYEDAADAAGISFQLAGEVHPEGDLDWPGFPEIMGSGACWVDIDGDGWEDLYLINQRYNPRNPATDGWIDRVDPTNELYLNDRCHCRGRARWSGRVGEGLRQAVGLCQRRGWIPPPPFDAPITALFRVARGCGSDG